MTSFLWSSSGSADITLHSGDQLQILGVNITALDMAGNTSVIDVLGTGITVTNGGYLRNTNFPQYTETLISGETRYLYFTNTNRLEATGTVMFLHCPGSGEIPIFNSLQNTFATITNTGGANMTANNSRSAIILESGGNTITNGGTITTNGTVEPNHETIWIGSIRAQLGVEGANSITNTGVIENIGPIPNFAIWTADDTDVVTNSGSITGSIGLGGGNDQCTNTGTIKGNVAVYDGNDQVKLQGGIVLGSIYLGDGDDVFDGRGGSLTGSVDGGGGDDTYILNSLTGFSISELPGGGTDELQIASSTTLVDGVENLTLLGVLNLDGGGNASSNVLNGNEGSNYLNGFLGNDTLMGNGGEDHLIGGDGNDRLFGGTGIDYLEGSAGRDLLRGGDNNDTLVGDTGADRLQGDAGLDYLTGGAGNDVLYGGTQDDVLIGGSGTDQLSGGAGNDKLNSGAGPDQVSGGNGNDVFVFNSWQENATANIADTITDFSQGDDVIDLRQIVPGKLTFISNGDFTGTAPEVLGFLDGAGRTVVIVDVDGNGIEDMGIFLNGEFTLTAADFLL